ncbi:hypothetical protein ACK30D_02045 [Aeromonas caviae]|uniref:hypothetical protein n=1 Tax=Aeromonas TaxID=642 RepID=UPI001C23901F|nr:MULTISPECIES: hypothetical protein [Aeromonas]QXB96509.1 hypothetical protein I6L36_06435 [Aeromonas sp. FDAARGOS 1406]
MKNADLPAMPVVNGDNEPAEFDRPFYRNSNLATGLTKREAIAMHLMQGLASNPSCGYTDYKYMASDAIRMTDSLLAELERLQP